MKYLPSVPDSLLKPRSQTVRSEDGRISFTIAPTSSGIFVERVNLRSRNARVVQSAVFTSSENFHRWCDADSVKFDYPLVYVNLRRDGDALFRQGR
jgi:hypothetical protein